MKSFTQKSEISLSWSPKITETKKKKFRNKKIIIKKAKAYEITKTYYKITITPIIEVYK